MLFKGNSSRLELLIEKIQANKENHNVSEQDIKDALGTDPGSSWRSETPEDQTSPSPSSCATPNSATDVPDAELTFTVGVTEGTPYACQFCDKAFPRLSYLKKHEQTHSDQMPFRCEFCSRLFKHKRSRDRHIKLHTGDKKYRCSHCEAAFSRSDHLKIHMKTHDNQKPFQCTVCNRGYNTAAALTSHMQNHKKDQNGQHSNGGSSNNTPSPGNASSFRCLQCGDSFRKPEELQGHMMTQHRVETGGGGGSRGLLGGLMLGEPPFPTPKLACMYCTKDSFTTLEALQLHVQAMHGSILNGDMREYPGGGVSPSLPPHHLLAATATASPSPSSTVAPTSTVTSSASSVPYSCDLCTMRFSSLPALHKHSLAVHGGGAALFCSQCSLTFPSPALFAEHYVLMHEQVKPTDLSKKSSSPSSSRSHDSRSPPKRHKLDPSLQQPETATSLGGLPYEHPGTLLCNQCSAALPDFESFRTHLKSHLEEANAGAGGSLRGLLGGSGDPNVVKATSPGTAGCPHCGAKFEDHTALEAHIVSHFMATATEYGCQSCLKLFSKPDELQKHLMDIHAHHLYRCSLCKEMFDSKVAIQVHFAVKHSNECKLFRCTACPGPAAVFRSELDFGLHVRSTHAPPPPPPPLKAPPQPPPPQPQPHRCLFCRLSFSTELEMQFHLSVHSKQFHCPLCQESFHVEFLLDKHMQTHHSTQVLNGSSGEQQPQPQQQQQPPQQQQQKSPKSKSAPAPPTPCSTPTSNPGSGKKSDSGGCCDICERRDFSSEAELQAHRKLAHHVPKPSKGGSGQGSTVSLHCAYCSENCKSRTELENHMKTHSQGGSGSGKHKCNICDELCPSAAVLAEHKLTHCKVVAGSACTQCKAALPSEEQFFAHLQQHGGGSGGGGGSASQVALPTPCVICRQTLISDIEVRMHARFHLKNCAQQQQQQQHSSEPPLYQCCLCLKQHDLSNLIPAGGSNGVVPSSTTYVCKDCYHCHSGGAAVPPNSSSSSPALHDQQAFRCTDCQVKFETASALEAHLVAVHRKTFQCIKCQVSFETEREIQMHVATHLLTEGSSHECHLCRRLLATPLKLQAHLIEHTFAGCGSFTCYLCSAVFTAAQGLQQHMLEHGLAARPYDCSRCSLRFFFRAELDNHSYTHLEEDAAAASHLLDGAEMAAKAAYYHHMTTNGGTPEMQYYKTLAQESSKMQKHKSGKSKSPSSMLKCLECNKEFSSMMGLQAHQRHHHKSSGKSKQQQHTCTECGKEFGLLRNLSMHMRTHHHHNGDMEEQQQICPVCRKELPDIEALESHVMSQHFRCPQCNEVFSRQRHLSEHTSKVHGVPEVKQEPVEVKEEQIEEEEEEEEDEHINVSDVVPPDDAPVTSSPQQLSPANVTAEDERGDTPGEDDRSSPETCLSPSEKSSAH